MLGLIAAVSPKSHADGFGALFVALGFAASEQGTPNGKGERNLAITQA